MFVLKRNYSTLENKYQDLEKINIELGIVKKDLIILNDELKVLLEKSNKKIDSLNIDLLKKESKIKEWENKFNKLESLYNKEHDEFNKRLNSYLEINNSEKIHYDKEVLLLKEHYNNRLKKSDSDLIEITSTYNELQNKYNKLFLNLNKCQSENFKLNKEFVEINNHKNELEIKYIKNTSYQSEILEENESLKTKINEILIENKKLQSEISNFRIDRAGYMRKISELEREIFELKSENSKLEDDFNKELNKINLEKTVSEEEVKKLQEIKEENLNQTDNQVESVKCEIPQEEVIINRTWSIGLYQENKNDLYELLKTFGPIEFKEIYEKAFDMKILKNLDKKNFHDLFARINLKMNLTRENLEFVENIYSKIMENECVITKEKIIESNQTISLYEEEVNNEAYVFDNFNSSHWFKLAQLSKNNNKTTNWLRKFIFSLGLYYEEHGALTEKQLDVIRNNYSILKYHMEKVLEISEEKIKREQAEEGEIKKIEIQKNSSPKCFNDLLNIGLEYGTISMEELQKLNFDNDVDAYDVYEAIEILESRGIQIKY